MSFEELVRHYTQVYTEVSDKDDKQTLAEIIGLLWERNNVEYTQEEIKRRMRGAETKIVWYTDFLLAAQKQTTNAPINMVGEGGAAGEGEGSRETSTYGKRAMSQ